MLYLKQRFEYVHELCFVLPKLISFFLSSRTFSIPLFLSFILNRKMALQYVVEGNVFAYRDQIINAGFTGAHIEVCFGEMKK